MAPRPLPKLDYRGGVPDHDRTIVVVPVLIGSADKVPDLLSQLELRYLGNSDPHIHYAILSDFADADAETTVHDAAIIEEATRGIHALNQRHGAGRFLFLHRARRLNPATGRWMGWERKRGKIEEFNRLVLGHHDTSFDVQVGDVSVIPRCRYVITLDADTQLPPDSARRLVGTIAHPLNRPRFDATVGRVTEGYGVLQPRVDISLPSASRSWFAQSCPDTWAGIPYTTAASDVYQDLFHEGSYVGKGIYDPRAFHAALAGRVRDNTLLSHDLFEGFFARAGLVADVHLVDDFPGHYLTWATRLHRWVRGDWQIAGWLGRTVVGADGTRMRNPLPVLARWKILDNLRRSLLSPSLVVLLALGWTVLPGSAITWTLLCLLVLAYPAYLRLGESLNSRVRGVPLGQHLRSQQADLAASARQALLTATFLAHQAWVMADAIGRTLWRMIVSRQHLLEWESASDAARRLSNDASAAWRHLWISPAVALLARADRPWRPSGPVDWRRAAAGALDARAGHRVQDRLATRQHDRAARRGRPAAAAPRGASDVALLRRDGDRRAQLARHGQLSGGPEAAGGLPHVAHQHRPSTAVDRRRTRSRLPDRVGSRRSARAHPRVAGAGAEVPRAPVQLGRHHDAHAPASVVRVHGGQRKLRRLLPDHPRSAERVADDDAVDGCQCASGAGRRPGPGRGARPGLGRHTVRAGRRVSPSSSARPI